MASDEDSVRFILELGCALHRHGAAAPRVEAVMGLAAQRSGLDVQIFAEPTSIVVSFGSPPDQRTSLLRVEPGSVHLENRTRIDEIATAFVEGRITARDGYAALARLEAETRPLSSRLTLFAFTLASGTAARFFGGGLADQAVASLLGLSTGLLMVATRGRALARVVEPTAAAVAAFLGMAAALVAEASPYTVTVSALIVLLPGLSFTTAVTELALRHLASGTSRLMGSGLSFLGLAFGVALGRRAGLLLPAAAAVPLEPPPAWTLLPSLVLAPVAYGLILRAAARDLPWLILAGAVAFGGSRAGIALLGPEIGAFAGAFLVGSFANAWGRILGRPSLTLRLPGLLMLVPGSVGFRSFEALLLGDVHSGVAIAFQMALIAIAIVSGLIVANVLVLPRGLDGAET
jgi:uncharacterized membrane protein YjjP (DUF1212 family)